MSTVKKIWIAVAVFVTIMLGFSFAIIQMSSYDAKSVTAVKKPIKKMIMKCGEGKCGVSMMKEVKTEAQ